MTKNKDKTPKGKKLLFTLLAILVIVLIIAVYFIAKYLSGYDITGLPPHGRSDDTVELQVDPGTDEDEEQTEREVDYFIDENGKYIPDYDTVEENEYDPALFRTENGRVYYDSDDVRYGIDVSSHQEEIDWEKVAADGIDYAIIRAAYRGYGQSGTINEDEYFRRNAEGAKNAGLHIGAYIFSQAITPDEAREEAEYLINMVKDYTVDYPIVFDWEPINYDTARTDGVTREQLTEIAMAFCERIKQAGYYPAVYLNTDQGYMEYDLEQVSKYDIWLADYDDIPDFYYKFLIWQYTNKGEVDGITGSVDLNISFKNYAG